MSTPSPRPAVAPHLVLLLLLVVVGAWLAAHVTFEWLARRYLVVSGAEYLVLGLLLGPEGTGLVGEAAVARLAPFLTLGLGWVGALVGVELELALLRRVPRGALGRAAGEALLTLTAVSLGMTALLAATLDQPPAHVVVLGMAFGAVAVTSAPAASMVAHGGRGNLHLLRQIQVTAVLDAVLAIVVLAALLAVSHPGGGAAAPFAAPAAWVAIALAIGLAGGLLVHLFIGPDTAPDRLFIGLGGAIVLVSGAAAHLRLTPLLPALVLAALLVNTSRSREPVRRALRSVERPLYFVMLLLAGLLWQPPGTVWILPVALFVGLRLVSKWGVARLLARRPRVPARWGFALLGHGGLGLAVALGYRMAEDPAVSGPVFTAALASILVTDVFSARWARRGATPRGAHTADAAAGPPVVG